MRSTKSLLSSIAVSAVLIAGAAFFGWKFYTELNSEISNTGGVQVGSVAVVQGNAERRYDRQTRWGSVKGAESLFNLDALRTSGNSGAVLELHYIDEAGIEKTDELVLGPDTYVVLDLLGETRNIQFVGGDLSATGAEGLTVTAGETIIAAVDGSVNLDRQEGRETNVTVTEGEARVTTASGETIVNSETSLKVDEETGKAERLEVAVNPILPGANALLLTYGDEREVNFTWELFAPWSDPAIEISRDASFDENNAPVFRTRGNGSASLTLAPSRWFWRILDESTGETGPTLLFTVDQERTVKTISPADNTEIPFRGDTPEVSLQWRQSYFADSYTVEMSRTSSFTSVISSHETTNGTTLIGNLDEGTWWWQVSPSYRRARLDSLPQTAGGSFTLDRKQGHDPPKLVSPAQSISFSGLDVRDGIDFRWQSESDLINYRIEIATDPEFSNILAVSEAPENFRNNLLPAPADATYYWRVTATATDGQPVPVSETRDFTIRPITGSVELVDPAPGEVKEMESYAAHTFLWRSSIPGTARFQLQRIVDAGSDERIKIIESLVNGESFTAPLPGEGSYAWKIQILDVGGRVLVESPEARFRLRSEFGSPMLNQPVPGSIVNLVGSTSLLLSWDPAPGADAFKVVLRAPDGSTIGRDDRVGGLEREFALPGDAGTGDYSVELTSIRDNPPAGGSRESQSAVYRFRVGDLVRYSAAVPTSPANGSYIDGLDAVSEGITLRWTQSPSLGRWTVELNNGRNTRIYRTSEPYLNLEDLESGSYSWQVRSSDGLGQDAPDSSISRFNVGAVPDPAAPRVTSPQTGENRDMTGADRLVFEWQPAADADFYDLALYVRGSDIPIIRETGLTGNRFVLRNLRILDVGDYVLALRARAEYEEVGMSLSSDYTRVPFSLSLNISENAPDILTDELQYAE